MPFDVPLTYVPIVGSDEMFSIRRIYCIGRNYAAIAREMGSDPTREPSIYSKNLQMRFSKCPLAPWPITPIRH